MSIYPKGVDPRKLYKKFEIAAYDLRVPDDLTDYGDYKEWDRYLRCLPPGRLLKKYEIALDELDQLCVLLEETDDPMKLPEEKQKALHAKYEAAYLANNSIIEKFRFYSGDREYPESLATDIEVGLYYLIDFLKASHSADLVYWQAKQLKMKNLAESDSWPKLFQILDKCNAQWSQQRQAKLTRQQKRP